MPKRLSENEVRKYIEAKDDFLISGYSTSKELMEIRCGKCGETYRQNYDRFRRGYQHRNCRNPRKPGPDKTPKIPSLTCPICATIFQTNNKNRKTCSPECKNKLEENKVKEINSKNYIYDSYTEKLRKFRKNYRMGKACEICGEDNINVLEFAHFKRDNKDCGLSSSCSPETLEGELKKGRLLCVWCHRLETREELNQIKQENLNKWKKEDFVEEGVVCKGPLCKGRKKSPNSFYKRQNGVLHYSCKSCIAYQLRQKREESYNFVNQIKLDLEECSECNVKVTEATTCCFDFDHIDPFYKDFTISNMCKNGKSKELILKEIEKCRLLCCKCHRLHTIKQQNHIDYREYNYEKKMENLKDKYNIS